MSGALRKGDTLLGTASEHNDHDPECENIVITGEVATGSHNVLINGRAAARKGDTTNEYDKCDDGTGVISSGSSSVLINGLPAARQNDSINTHAGTANFTSSSTNVIIGK